MIQIPIGINTEAWDEWCEFRRIEKKKKVGPIAAKKQFKMLLKYTEEEQQVIIDNSISNGYQGLFDIKGNGGENNQRTTTQRRLTVSEQQAEAKRQGERIRANLAPGCDGYATLRENGPDIRSQVVLTVWPDDGRREV